MTGKLESRDVAPPAYVWAPLAEIGGCGSRGRTLQAATSIPGFAVNKKQKKARAAVLEGPLRPLPLHRFESVLAAEGFELTTGEGASVVAIKEGVSEPFHFHRPHRGNEAGKGLVLRLRKYLEYLEDHEGGHLN